MVYEDLQRGKTYEIVCIETGEMIRMQVTMKNLYGIQCRMNDRKDYWFMSKTVFNQNYKVIG